MSREDAIHAEGIVVETLPNGLFRVELPNGHRLLARLAGRARLGFVRLVLGVKVTVELSPYDLSKGAIVLE